MNILTQKEKHSLVYALISITLWSTVATVSKVMLKNISSFQLMFYVSLFSSLSAFFFLVVMNKIHFMWSTLKEDGISVFVLGFLWLWIQQFLYFTALENAPAAQVNVLNYMWPILILLLSVFIWKEKLSFRIIFSFLLGILGTTIVITKWNPYSLEEKYLYGYFLSLSAAFCWALFSVINKKKKYEPISVNFLFNVSGFIFMIFIMIFTKSSFTLTISEFIGTFYIGVFPTAIAFVLWIKALQIWKASSIANLWHLTPFISLLFIFFVLKEPILMAVKAAEADISF